MDNIAAVEDTVQADFFLYTIDIVDRSVIGELARASVRKHYYTVRLLNYSCHICYVSNIKAFLKAYRCPSCDQFINKAGSLERHLATSKEKIKHVFPKNMYQLRETNEIGKLDSFNILYSKDLTLSEHGIIRV